MKQFNNNDFTIKNLGQSVTLFGWVAKKRNLGGLIFIDLRDRSGIIQVIVKPDNSNYALAETIKNEYVLEVEGIIAERESKNANLITGEIEVIVSKIKILNTSSELPFEISDKANVLEEIRLKYRYLDIRRNEIKDKLITRHNIVKSVHNYLDTLDFIEVETPILNRSTPEGARDYLVPSRVNKGTYYALPQSPQIFKQLLMVGGIEKYYQIARCFRDEDLRADRQPEFTQIDIEMSFVEEKDIMTVTEGLFKQIFKDIKNIDIVTPFNKIRYDDAINFYGSDKPDTRFDLKLNDVTSIFKNCEMSLIKDVVTNKGIVNCIVVNNAAEKFSRKDIEKLEETIKTYRAKNLFWLKYSNNELTGSIAKSMNEEEMLALKTQLNLVNDDLILIVADKKAIVKNSLGALRLKLAKDLDLIKEGTFDLLWVVDFPLFDYNEEENRLSASHHPFTAPKDEDLDNLTNNPKVCYAKAYDIVLNGYEAGGGSIRIHNQNTQQKMFEALGLTQAEIENKFGFLMDAFQYGTPPHGGIALGLERLTMILSGTDNIKNVVAFPKTASAACLMSSAPNIVDHKQLKELGIKNI